MRITHGRRVSVARVTDAVGLLERREHGLEDDLRGQTRMNPGGGGIGGFIPAETLVHNGTAGDNGTPCGTLNQPILGRRVG